MLAWEKVDGIPLKNKIDFTAYVRLPVVSQFLHFRNYLLKFQLTT